MQLVKLLLIAAVAGGAYAYHAKRTATAEATQSFVPVPPVQGLPRSAVMVLAAQNCPQDAALRADRLTEALRERGVEVVRSNQVSFDASAPLADLTRVNAVLDGPLPTVFVGGRAKANPRLDEVLVEVERARF